MCLCAPQSSLPRAAGGGQGLSFPTEAHGEGTDRSHPPQRSRACLLPPAQLRWGDSIFLLLLGKRSPCPRQSRSREELLQLAVVILDYKVVGDFFFVV